VRQVENLSQLDGVTCVFPPPRLALTAREEANTVLFSEVDLDLGAVLTVAIRTDHSSSHPSALGESFWIDEKDRNIAREDDSLTLDGLVPRSTIAGDRLDVIGQLSSDISRPELVAFSEIRVPIGAVGTALASGLPAPNGLESVGDVADSDIRLTAVVAEGQEKSANEDKHAS
jgi:hypothetical protein